jgi:hypothetical protein
MLTAACSFVSRALTTWIEGSNNRSNVVIEAYIHTPTHKNICVQWTVPSTLSHHLNSVCTDALKSVNLNIFHRGHLILLHSIVLDVVKCSLNHHFISFRAFNWWMENRKR